MGAQHDQADFTTRFEWGAEGIGRVAPGSACIVIVDILRFSTAVDVAVANGAEVYPYQYAGASAMAFAKRIGGRLADGSPYSLSPASLRSIPTGTRLVLPSPNGATLTLIAAESGVPHVFAGCLRNATAVAGAVRRIGGTVTVIAAGERRGGGDGPLRPCFEELVGAVIATLQATTPSPEAFAAAAAFRAVASDLLSQLQACSSGRELRQRGLQRDIVIAVEQDGSDMAPVLQSGAFVARRL
jgi:2-phosphosulfolactate phosphatase